MQLLRLTKTKEMTWEDFIQQEMKKDHFVSLSKFLAKESKEHTIYPPKEDIFNAFKYCPLDKVKIVLLGQDCYHSEKQAHGLSFSVKRGIPIPPSLKNIYKELKGDLNIEPPNHGCLEHWASQGVFLLNAILTVRKGEAGSHRNKGWEIFTDNAIKLINEQDRPIAYILWGSFAKSKKPLITSKNAYIQEGNHPSPLSAHTGFFGGKYFSRCNDFLIKNNIEPINWGIE